jgi:hypothetical protein
MIAYVNYSQVVVVWHVRKKVCICDKLVKADWKHLLLSFFSSSMPLSLSDFDFITPPKTTPVPVTKTYAVVITTPVNEQVENIKKYIVKKWQNWTEI